MSIRFRGATAACRGNRHQHSSNRIFKVHAETELEAARILKPAVILYIMDMAGDFEGLNIEFNTDSSLLFSMGKLNLLDSDIHIDIEYPAKTAEQLMKVANQPSITKLLGVIGQIERFGVSELARIQH